MISSELLPTGPAGRDLRFFTPCDSPRTDALPWSGSQGVRCSRPYPNVVRF